MTTRSSNALLGLMGLRRGLWTLATMTLLATGPGCGSEAEQAAESERKAAGEEARRKAALSIDEHEKACEKDDAVSCVALATAYQVGEDREADPVKSQALFEKACKLGNGPACIDAADPYLNKGELEKARPLVEAGCKQAEHDDCCTRLATIDQKLAKDAGADAGAAAEAGEAKGEGEGEGEEEMSEAERLMAEIEAAEKDDDEG